MEKLGGRETFLCPSCGSMSCTVRDSRPTESSRRRRRMCQNCGLRFTTFEVVQRDGPRPYHHWEKEERLLRLIGQANDIADEMRSLAEEILGGTHDVRRKDTGTVAHHREAGAAAAL